MTQKAIIQYLPFETAILAFECLGLAGLINNDIDVRWT